MFDAFLLVSFGGPESREDVLPFLENVTRGRNIPRARLEGVAEHYYHFDGRSPINDQNRALLSALRSVWPNRGLDIPIYWGNRNWHPMLEDVVAQMAKDGVRRAAAFVTSAFGSYSGCRQYRQDLERACRPLGAKAPELVKLPQFYNHKGFLEPQIRALKQSLDQTDEPCRVLFTAHSIPVSMATTGPYREQLQAAADHIANAVGITDYALVFQSRSGPPTQPWLEPDINDAIKAAAAESVSHLKVLPLGFVSDHMEVVWDLDHEAKDTAAELGVAFERLPTVGVSPEFIEMIADFVVRPDFEEDGPARLFAPPKSHCFPGCCDR